ncbi:MAG TPA: helix-turn-helix domain-containing protein [Kofleriaceae bacterium]
MRTEQESADDTGEQCVAASEAVLLFKDKWTILVLGSLGHAGSLRYNELQRRITGISQRMLTLTLKTLEQHGLVTRTMFASVPPRVDYALTPMGHSLGQPLKALLEWSLEHRSEMAAARRAYATAKRGS